MNDLPLDDAPEPQIVYHYTSMATMMEILQSASIWATNINYLNDVTEGIHYLNLIRARIPIYCTKRQVVDKSIFDKFLDEMRSPRIEQSPFVASFSKEADSLPQWRSYCPAGNGVAIGFRVDCLKRSFVKSNQSLTSSGVSSKAPSVAYKQVDYIQSPSVQSLDNQLDDMVLASSQLVREHFAENLQDDNNLRGELFALLMRRIACFKKHPSFSNEREYRLLVDQVLTNSGYLEFRPSRSTLVPYIVVQIPREDPCHTGETGTMSALAGRWQFIDRIVVGPSVNSELSFQSVNSFIRKHALHVQVESSSIPYRDW